MVLITIVNGAYKPTYYWGAPHCIYIYTQMALIQVSEILEFTHLYIYVYIYIYTYIYIFVKYPSIK